MKKIILEVLEDAEFVLHITKLQFIFIINALMRVEPVDTSSSSYKLGTRFNSAFDGVGKGTVCIKYNNASDHIVYNNCEFYLEIDRSEFRYIVDAIEEMYDKLDKNNDNDRLATALRDLRFFIGLAYDRLDEQGTIEVS